MKKTFRLSGAVLLILASAMLLAACGSSSSDSDSGNFDFSGTYTDVTYKIFSGTCGLSTGDHSGDDVVVTKLDSNRFKMSFGIPGFFWTEFTTDAIWDGSEYDFNTNDTLFEGGSWTGEQFSIEGKFEPNSVWAHVVINGSSCQADLEIWGYK